MGAAVPELFEASANGNRVRFTRNLGNIVMDLNDIEGIDLNTLGSTDATTVNDLSGTDVVEINVNQAGTIGGSAGDDAADIVIVNGTNGADIVDLVRYLRCGPRTAGAGEHHRLRGRQRQPRHQRPRRGRRGTATTVPAGIIKLTIDGGAGDDQLLGSQGADVFLGGDDDDFVVGDNGNDVAFLGGDDDVFQWNPGDGNDTIEGQGGHDEMLFFGANVAENIQASPTAGG